MRVLQTIISALLLSCVASGVMAGDYPVHYCGIISEQDRVSSSGARLSTIGQIIQQDRANFHRFNRRDTGDEHDPYFTTSEARAQIQPMFAQNPRAYTLRDEARIVRSTQPVRFCVEFQMEGAILMNFDSEALY